MPRHQLMLMSVSNNKKEVLLQPSWLGKINWSNGIPTSPDKYMASRAKIINYWGEYRSPIWDDLYEYRKSFSTNNYNSYDSYNSYNLYNSYNNYENISDLQDKENQFITISKNKKIIKQAKYSSSQLNNFYITPEKEIDSAEISDSEYKNVDYDDVINDIQEDIPDIPDILQSKDNYDYTEDNF